MLISKEAFDRVKLIFNHPSFLDFTRFHLLAV